MATHYEHVQNILGTAAGGASPVHDGNGRFWEKTLAEFQTLTIYGQQLIANAGPNRGRNSALVKALKGEAPFDGTLFSRMPLGRAPVSPATIVWIEQWIDDDMPDVETQGPVEEGADPQPDTGTSRPNCSYTITHANTYRQSTGNVMIRKNILALTDEELRNFRTAIQALKDLPAADARNFDNQARIHGTSCRHGSELFLPWHRAYLVEFERLLQEQVPGVTLPYWDWANTREIPQPYREPSALPDFPVNPLFDATRLNQTNDAGLPTLTDENNALALSDWLDFGGAPVSSGLAGAVEASNHNSVHGWVGGNIGGVPTAGFDPLFWALHSDVDRIWAVWQTTHSGGPSDPTPVLDPFGMAVGDTASVRALGYDYAGLDSTSVMDTTQGCANYCAPPQDIPERMVHCGCRRAWVCLYDVLHPAYSFRIRVYLNQPDADARSKTTIDYGYAGHVSTFGMGEHMPKRAHMNDYCPPRPGKRPTGSHDIPYNTRVDCTEVVNRICSEYRKGYSKGRSKGQSKGRSHCPTIQIKLVSVDGGGKPMPDDALKCRQIALEITE